MTPDRREHRMSLRTAEDIDSVIAWKCEVCGHWVNEYGPRDETSCPVTHNDPAT